MGRLKENRVNYLTPIMFICIVAILLWRCRFGYAKVDEVFYLATPYRLITGDGLFVHEWHLSQLSSVLIMPIMKLYCVLVSDTDGMVLAFRYICVGFMCLEAAFIYFRLKKINVPASYTAAVCFMLYVPFGIIALSYNSMGIMLLLTSLVIMFTSEKNRDIEFILAGLAYAGAVLCCPYLVLGWLIQAAVLTVRLIRKDKDSLREFICFTMGAAFVAALFVAFVLSRASLEEIIKALPNIMNDPEHMPVGFVQRTKDLITAMLYASPHSLYIYAVLFAVFGACAIDRNRRKRKKIYLPATALTCAMLMAELMIYREHINLILWPVNILGFMAFMLTGDEKAKRILFSLWIPGMFYALCIHFSSNLAYLAFSSASSVAVPGSLLLIAAAVNDEERSGKFNAIKLAAAAFAVFLVCSLGYFRVDRIYFGEKLSEQTECLSEGIQKGIVCAEEHLDVYYALLDDIGEIQEMNYKKLLFLSEETGCYIESSLENCGYSAWLSGVHEHSLGRLEAYWQLNPDKRPEAVYTEKKNMEIVLPLCEKLGLKAKELNNGYIFS